MATAVDSEATTRGTAPSPSVAELECRPPGRALTTIRIAHTLIWFSVEFSMGYLLFAGVARRTDRRAAVAGFVVAGETLVFAANGFRCPLTALAEALGAENGAVTDIYLPSWFARNLPAIHVPLVLVALLLHARNRFVRSRSDRVRSEGPPALDDGASVRSRHVRLNGTVTPGAPVQSRRFRRRRTTWTSGR